MSFDTSRDPFATLVSLLDETRRTANAVPQMREQERIRQEGRSDLIRREATTDFRSDLEEARELRAQLGAQEVITPEDQMLIDQLDALIARGSQVMADPGLSGEQVRSQLGGLSIPGGADTLGAPVTFQTTLAEAAGRGAELERARERERREVEFSREMEMLAADFGYNMALQDDRQEFETVQNELDRMLRQNLELSGQELQERLAQMNIDFQGDENALDRMIEQRRVDLQEELQAQARVDSFIESAQTSLATLGDSPADQAEARRIMETARDLHSAGIMSDLDYANVRTLEVQTRSQQRGLEIDHLEATVDQMETQAENIEANTALLRIRGNAEQYDLENTQVEHAREWVESAIATGYVGQARLRELRRVVQNNDTESPLWPIAQHYAGENGQAAINRAIEAAGNFGEDEETMRNLANAEAEQAFLENKSARTDLIARGYRPDDLRAIRDAGSVAEVRDQFGAGGVAIYNLLQSDPGLWENLLHDSEFYFDEGVRRNLEPQVAQARATLEMVAGTPNMDQEAAAELVEQSVSVLEQAGYYDEAQAESVKNLYSQILTNASQAWDVEVREATARAALNEANANKSLSDIRLGWNQDAREERRLQSQIKLDDALASQYRANAGLLRNQSTALLSGDGESPVGVETQIDILESDISTSQGKIDDFIDLRREKGCDAVDSTGSPTSSAVGNQTECDQIDVLIEIERGRIDRIQNTVLGLVDGTSVDDMALEIQSEFEANLTNLAPVLADVGNIEDEALRTDLQELVGLLAMREVYETYRTILGEARTLEMFQSNRNLRIVDEPSDLLRERVLAELEAAQNIEEFGTSEPPPPPEEEPDPRADRSFAGQVASGAAGFGTAVGDVAVDFGQGVLRGIGVLPRRPPPEEETEGDQ